ncbi:MAG: FliO/MopB family protein, partial [Gemmatimonadaceae bacterium]|nr:FliO/MopB family protein [Gemmatimonadaceae bacterium]
MTAAGYAGMLATLAFVLGLVLLVAKLAKRFLPGAMQAGGTDTFSVVQRIALGQRQGIAVVQRGDVLIGVSVGEGGVRTLFTMPAESGAGNARSIAEHDDATDIDIDAGGPATASGFPRLLGDAIRGRMARAMMLMIGTLATSVLSAQTAAPARPAQQP